MLLTSLRTFVIAWWIKRLIKYSLTCKLYYPVHHSIIAFHLQERRKRRKDLLLIKFRAGKETAASVEKESGMGEGHLWQKIFSRNAKTELEI